MGKIRRVDFYPDEFLSGVDQLSPEEIGVYWSICSKIYSRGEVLPDDDREHARIFRLDPRTWRRIKAALVAKGKIRIEDGTIINDRCMAELSKAGKRIEDARAAGHEGGRPRGTPNATSASTSIDEPATVGTTIGEPSPQLLPNRWRTVGDRALRELSQDNDVGKAAGFSGEKLTSNQQPATYQPPEEAPPTKVKAYAFTGRVIRLTTADFDKWQIEFRETIPDLMAQLADDDAYYDRTLIGKDRAQWFHRLHRKLLKLHQRALGERARDQRPDLADSF